MLNLNGIDLQDSWVLNWCFENNDLIFSIEFSLWPQSPYYEEPKDNEYTCYKIGALTFHGVNQINGLLSVSNVKPTTDPNGKIDYGNIDFMNVSLPNCHIVGDFGNVTFTCAFAELYLN